MKCCPAMMRRVGDTFYPPLITKKRHRGVSVSEPNDSVIDGNWIYQSIFFMSVIRYTDQIPRIVLLIDSTIFPYYANPYSVLYYSLSLCIEITVDLKLTSLQHYLSMTLGYFPVQYITK